MKTVPTLAAILFVFVVCLPAAPRSPGGKFTTGTVDPGAGSSHETQGKPPSDMAGDTSQAKKIR